MRSVMLLLAATAMLAKTSFAWSFLQSSTTANATSTPPPCASGAGTVGVYWRHCDFQGYATHLGCHSGTDMSDAQIDLIAPLDQQIAGPTTVSLLAAYSGGQSWFVTAPKTGDRAGLEQNDGSKDFAARATFSMQQGPVGSGTVMFVSQSAGGKALTLQASLSGTCSGQYATAAGEGDVVMADPSTVSAASASWVVQADAPLPPPAPVSATVDAGSVSSYTIEHMASVGIEFLNHEIYGGGLWAQMVFGESFEEVENGKSTVSRRSATDESQWGFIGCQGGRTSDTSLLQGVSEMWTAVREGAQGDVSLRVGQSDAFNGQQYQSLALPALPASAPNTRLGLANYGLNCQLGMQFQAGKPYDGAVYARSFDGGSVTLYAAAEDSQSGSSLDEVPLTLPADGQWHRLAFTLTPSAAAGCGSMTDGTDPTRQVATCFGRFVVALRGRGGEQAQSADIDLVELLPGAWGLVEQDPRNPIGVPARKDVADLFAAEGIRVLRNGGSMDNRPTYRWKDFRGPRDMRQPYQGLWYEQEGLTQSRRFSMFEVIDTCAVIGCRPVITLNNLESATDMADFVEYCWGGNNTQWGLQRHMDGHPEPYNVTFVEIGNEQGLDDVLLDTFINITNHMDARSKALGLPLFDFAIGHNLNTGEVQNEPQRNMTSRFIEAAGALYPRGHWDFHIGDGEDGGAELETLIEAFQSLSQELGKTVFPVVFEENGNDHGLARAVGHAAFSNVFMRHADIAKVHGFADAIEAWQGMNAEQAFPQGQIFFSPNASWLQPPGHAISMVEHSHASHYIHTTLNDTSASVDVVALTDSPPGTTPTSIVLRIVSWYKGGQPGMLSLSFQNGFTPATQATGQILSDPVNPDNPDPTAQNTLANMTAIVPRDITVDPTKPIAVPALSFMVLTVKSA